MNYLFIHQNFPAQYIHLLRHLAGQPGNQLLYITQPNANSMSGVQKITYPKDQRGSINCHAYSIEIDRAIYAAAAVADKCRELRSQGFRPDLIVGHSGWGETMFVKDVFPDVPLLANFEFYYHSNGVDVGFDPEFVSVFQDPSRLRVRNATNLLAFEGADWGHSATRWQRSLYPPEMRSRISAIHEGVDTDIVRPNRGAKFKLPGSDRVLTREDQVVTFVSRNLEPYRGFHTFMRALPQLLRRCKRAEVVIVGGDGVSYGTPPPPRSTFKKMMLEELGTKIDLTRVHFVGMQEYHNYLNLAAGLLGPCVSDLPVRAVLVVHRSDGVRMSHRGFADPARARGPARRGQRARRWISFRPKHSPTASNRRWSNQRKCSRCAMRLAEPPSNIMT